VGTEFTVLYEAGHSYQERWEDGEYFCPGCGAREVWEEMGEGDYYQGPEFLCLACGASFWMPSGPDIRTDNSQDRQRLEALRGLRQNEEETC